MYSVSLAPVFIYICLYLHSIVEVELLFSLGMHTICQICIIFFILRFCCNFSNEADAQCRITDRKLWNSFLFSLCGFVSVQYKVSQLVDSNSNAWCDGVPQQTLELEAHSVSSSLWQLSLEFEAATVFAAPCVRLYRLLGRSCMEFNFHTRML